MLKIKGNFAVLTTALVSALSLTGCGGGTSSSDTDSTVSSFSITAMDGYLKNADVWVDANGGNNNCETNLGLKTGDGGIISIPIQYQKNTICIKAIAGQTIDETRGVVENTLELKAPAGETTVSPFTSLVVEQLEADDTLTIDSAKDKVIAEIGLSEVADVVFGDYVKKAAGGDDKAKAVNIIGEILFDEDADQAGLTAIEKLAIVEAVSDDVQDAIDDGTIDDYSPDITVAGDGTVTVTENRRPTLTGSASSSARGIDLGDPFSLSVEEWFEDKDSDGLTYEFKTLPDFGANLEISEKGVITGTPSAAGTYTIYVYARDAKDVRSYPVVFDLNVISPNTPPAVNGSEKDDIQSEITNLGLRQYIPVDRIVSIAELFTDDDGDTLTITIDGDVTGLRIGNTNDQLTFGGTPLVNTEDSPLSFTVKASDGNHVETAEAQFALTIAKDAGFHPLEGKPWYKIGRGSDDGDDNDQNNYTRVWCTTLLFSGGTAYMNDRTSANRTECTADLVAAGSYVVESGKIKVTWSDQLYTGEYSLLSDNLADDGHGTLVKYIETDNKDSDETEAKTWFADKDDAEARVKLTSVTPEGQRDFQYYRKNGAGYELGQVSLSLGLPGEDSGDLDIDLYFDDLLASDAGCQQQVKNLFSSFAIAKSDYDDSLSFTTEFFDDGSGGCVVDFDISGATNEDQILGVIANANDARKADMSSLYFNIQQDFAISNGQ